MFYAGQEVTAGEMNAELLTDAFFAGQKVRSSQIGDLLQAGAWVRAGRLNTGVAPPDDGGIELTGTRLYLDHATADPAMAALGFRGPSTSGVTTVSSLLTTPALEADADSWGFVVGSSTTTRHVCLQKMVSAPLTNDGLLGGYVVRNVQAIVESTADLNAFYEEYIYVSDGSTADLRGVLLTANTDDIELSTGFEARLERYQLTPVEVQAGDRIVIEASVHLVSPDPPDADQGVFLWMGGGYASYYEFSHLDGLTVIPWNGDLPEVNAGLNATASVGSAFTRTAREVI